MQSTNVHYNILWVWVCGFAHSNVMTQLYHGQVSQVSCDTHTQYSTNYVSTGVHILPKACDVTSFMCACVYSVSSILTLPVTMFC